MPKNNHKNKINKQKIPMDKKITQTHRRAMIISKVTGQIHKDINQTIRTIKTTGTENDFSKPCEI